MISMGSPPAALGVLLDPERAQISFAVPKGATLSVR